MRKRVVAQEVINVYRTRCYIVEQNLYLKMNDVDNNELVSYDIFYKRDEYRDRKYERRFKKRKHIDGKRITTSNSARSYID